MTGTVELLGREFRVAEKMGLMPLLRFAHFARSGADTGDMEAMASMYDVLRAAIAEEDWEVFQQHAMDTRADITELLGAVKEAISVMTARPTNPPSDSSSGSSTIETSSLGGSSSEEFSIRIGGTSPLLEDSRVVELVPLTEAGRRLRGA